MLSRSLNRLRGVFMKLSVGYIVLSLVCASLVTRADQGDKKKKSASKLSVPGVVVSFDKDAKVFKAYEVSEEQALVLDAKKLSQMPKAEREKVLENAMKKISAHPI